MSAPGTRRAVDILDAVCRRVEGKTAVSHVFLPPALCGLHPHLARIRAQLGIALTVYNSMRADTGSDVPARLTALRARVVVMEVWEGFAEGLREVDWMVGLLGRFSLPPQIHRDWPVIRHGRN